MGREVFRTLETYSWQKAPAMILSSQVVESPDEKNPYSVRVEFRYTWNGTPHVSDRYQRSVQRSSDYSRMAAIVAAYPAGQEAECLVNPHQPEAILSQGDLWIGLFALIPLVFVLVGAGGIYAALSAGKQRKATPVSDGKKGGAWVRWLGLLFVAIGVAVLLLWYLPNTVQGLSSLRWEEIPCTIESSRVVEVDSDDGKTYRVDILYRYKYAGTEYRSNRYKIFRGSSSGRSAKQAVVDKFPPGSEAVCYVEPSNPQNAVLVRGLGWEVAIGLFPLVFIGVGALVFFSARPKVGHVVTPTLSDPDRLVDLGTRELKPRVGRLMKLAGIALAAVFWNGIVSVFLFNIIDEWQQGREPWFLTVFLVPFVLIGLALIGGVFYSLISLSNPKPVLHLTPGILTPGCSFDVAWSLQGAASRLQNLTIFLEGREEATYRRGTDSVTDRHVFARFAIAKAENPLEMAQGAARRDLPATVPPGFSSDNNKLLWTLRVYGKIGLWPDLHEEFDVEVAATPKR